MTTAFFKIPNPKVQMPMQTPIIKLTIAFHPFGLLDLFGAWALELLFTRVPPNQILQLAGQTKINTIPTCIGCSAIAS